MRLALIIITALALGAVGFDAWHRDPGTAGLCVGGGFIILLVIVAEWRNEREAHDR